MGACLLWSSSLVAKAWLPRLTPTLLDVGFLEGSCSWSTSFAKLIFSCNAQAHQAAFGVDLMSPVHVLARLSWDAHQKSQYLVILRPLMLLCWLASFVCSRLPSVRHAWIVTFWLYWGIGSLSEVCVGCSVSTHLSHRWLSEDRLRNPNLGVLRRLMINAKFLADKQR